MNQGVVLLAYNNGLDYIAMAKNVANRVKNFLELPVTLITDSKITDNCYDKIIHLPDLSTNFKTFNDEDVKSKLQWKNFNRSEVFHLSPYDHTIILDVDYIIQSNFLKKCLTLNKDLMMYKHSYNISGFQTNEFTFLNNFSIPFYWATVVIFRKTKKNELFFNYVRHIKNNWDYYKELYQIIDKKFRNDFAFSIALHIANGCISDESKYNIPGKLHYVTDKDSIMELQQTSCKFKVQDLNLIDNSYIVQSTNVDVHVMNKFSLLRCL